MKPYTTIKLICSLQVRSWPLQLQATLAFVQNYSQS